MVEEPTFYPWLSLVGLLAACVVIAGVQFARSDVLV
jgi:hypothetical protein